MAEVNGAITQLILNSATDHGARPSNRDARGKVRVFLETVEADGSSPANGDTILIGRVPKGWKYLFCVVMNDVSSGSSTFSIGHRATGASTITDADSIKTAAAKTTTGPELFAVPSAGFVGVEVTAEQDIVATIAGANMPAGTYFFYHVMVSDD